MPALNWNEFERLPGSPETNFETLCRALIHLHYGKFGSFRGTANQPGVEFHLQLNSNCAIGTPGEWLGWQCRWYHMPKVSSLGKTRRDKILKAVRTTEKVLSGITDWVLWTRFPLTASDQKWFYSIKTKMRLILWTATDAETFLSGYAEILRGTYFGELVLRPDNLAVMHDVSAASIRHRWLPEAHQQVDAERTMRRMLGEAAAWDEMLKIAACLASAEKTLMNGKKSLPAPLASMAANFVEGVDLLSDALKLVHHLLAIGDFDLLRKTLELRPSEPDRETTSVPRHLRSARSAMSFDATNALADIRLAHRMLRDMDSYLGTRLVAVIADAGGGKTQLAAQLTAPQNNRPAGILLHGRNLRAGQGLDNLAQRLVFQGKPFPSIEALIAALDAAGQRARQRLPLVIDGLNEAEDPRDWKGPLAGLDVLLRRYANVLVVCTLRTGARRPVENRWDARPVEETPARTLFADIALPEGIQRLALEGFGADTGEAIHRYFRHYRINAGDTDIPFDLLAHPLHLRIFCEVTNPKRDRDVGIEAMPRSLTALFERYLADTAKRIAELAPKPILYGAQDVRKVFDEIGSRLWEQRSRELSEAELRKAIGDDAPRLWDNSLVRLLEQEGVILRVESEVQGQHKIIPVYDAIGGYMIANALLSKLGRDGFKEWIKKPENLSAFAGSHEELHPLSVDIFQALAGLVPRRLEREQFWPLLDGRLRQEALLLACRLEGEFLDAATVDEIAKLVNQQDASTNIFVQLRHTRSSPGHPLNADFFDAELRKMSNADRDLRWTEWLRQIYKENMNHIEFGKAWRERIVVRTPSDRLRAKWFMWFLTITSHNFRDKATRELYWFGRGDPAAIFALTIDSLSINDPYVPERMLAASYGVVMAAHTETKNKDFSTVVLPSFARQVYEQMFKKDAPHGTTHVLMREYARRILQIVVLRKKGLFSKDELKRITPPYKDNGLREWKQIETKGEEVHGVDSPFGMDFENYTLGGLVPGRGNYDFKNPAYRKIRAQILWRIAQLGWTSERFKLVDQQIAGLNNIYRTDNGSRKIDRYGKKYSWIAYHEMKGIQRDAKKIEREHDDYRSWEVDIDPSFPSPPPNERLIMDDFLGDPDVSTREWIENGAMPNVSRYLRQKTVHSHTGPWVALDGFLIQEDKRRGRRLFCFVRAFLVPTSKVASLKTALTNQSMQGRWLPEKPKVRCMFAGEFPWCITFPKNEKTRLHFIVDERKVKVKRRRLVYFLDGKQIAISTHHNMRMRWFDLTTGIREGSLTKDDLDRVQIRNMIVEVEEIQQQSKDFDVMIPVCDFGWERSDIDDVPVSSTMLAKEIANKLNLVGIPQSLDAATKDGDRATCTIANRVHSYSNSQNLFFMREDLLRAYLRNNHLTLIWVAWGEREISTNLAMLRDGATEKCGAGFKVFSKVMKFS
jgi:hypothetical protein